MLARKILIRLKPNTTAEFTRTLQSEVLPLLQKQRGFQDEMTLVSPDGLEAVAISFWEEKKDADAYHHAIYPEVQKALMSVLAGPPQVRTYEVANSTLHALAAPTAL